MSGRLRRIVSWRRHFFGLEERRLERRYGVETGGTADLASLTVMKGDPTEGFMYVPTPPRLAKWWLDELPRRVDRFTFVDMGSGKGRILILAAERGFRRVIGVEFARELHEVALVNAEAARYHDLKIEPILCDAAAFAFPAEPLVVYFNNPFSGQVMIPVIRNISTSYALTPRPIAIVYQQLTVEDPGDRTKNIDLLKHVPFLSGRAPRPRGVLSRRLLAPYTVWIFESPELRPDVEDFVNEPLATARRFGIPRRPNRHP